MAGWWLTYPPPKNMKVRLDHHLKYWLLPFDYLIQPWKDPLCLKGKPFISMGHLYHGYVK